MLPITRAQSNSALLELSPNLPPRVNIDKRARKCPSSMARIAADWPSFVEEVAALDDSADDGFIIEDFVGVYQRFLRLVDAGVVFSPFFRGWMDGLRDQIRHTDADSDHDQDWADFENEDPNEDASDRHLIEHDPRCLEEVLDDTGWYEYADGSESFGCAEADCEAYPIIRVEACLSTKMGGC